MDKKNKEHVRHSEEKAVKGKEPKGFNWENWRNILLIGLAAILIINVIILFTLQNKVKDNLNQAEKQLKPAEIQLVSIQDSACAECFELEDVIASMKQGRVSVTKETTYNRNDKEAKDLIAKYGIERIPALIITGEVEKAGFAEQLQKKDDAYLFAQVPPPYIDVKTGAVKGKVSSTLLFRTDCKNCTDLNNFITQAKASGIYIADERSFESTSSQGQQLMSKYNIKKLPTLIFSSSLGDYEVIQQNWAQVGTTETDGSYVMRQVSPPYYDLDKKEVVGLVGLVYITDKNCTTCYDVKLHGEILKGLGVMIGHESTYDIASADGKDLVAEYNITKVPTIFLSDDLEAYPQMIEIWKQVGTADIDPDTNKTVYVFRSTEAMGPYKDLTTNTVVEPQQQTQ